MKGDGAVLLKAMKGKKRPLMPPPSGFNKRVEGASTTSSRVGY